MKKGYGSDYFRKILVPVFYDCASHINIQVAQMIAEERAITLAGMVGIKVDESLSVGATRAQEIRRTLRKLTRGTRLRIYSSVVVAHHLWDHLQRMIKEEEPDLLILEYPCHFDMMMISTYQVLSSLTCDVALVRAPIDLHPKNVLTPMRGGPHAELALRIALAIGRSQEIRPTSLHLIPKNLPKPADAPFRGISNVLEQIPELDKLELTGDKPDEIIHSMAPQYDLIVMGATARPRKENQGLGSVAERLLNTSPSGIVVVKTHRSMDPEVVEESAGGQAISVLVDRWFAQNTYHTNEFNDLDELVELKQRRNLTVSLALPALNEEETVGKVIRTIKDPLMDQFPLLDEIVLMDSNSTDRTRQIASDLGIPVYIHQEILPELGARQGKGEALWKSLFVTRGDILLWLDTDIVNIHPRFIYGLLGPLLLDSNIEFVKGFYRRPIKVGERVLAGGGGRVTELTARPLINLYFPELSGVIQPLSGEYGGRRSLLERLPFFSGYGVEIGLLIDVLKTSGLDAIAQVDLQERVHHNQPLEALSKMSFAIIQAVAAKLEVYSGYSLLEDVNRSMKMIRYETGRLYLDVEEIAERERPPILEIPAYQELDVNLSKVRIGSQLQNKPLDANPKRTSH
jgi:glycosyltransferase involved in cell wall biosynthesis/nucleotide-binding universal stress UspA family protein